MDKSIWRITSIMNSFIGIVSSGSNWVKFGNGLIIQWGIITNNRYVTYPHPFSNTNYVLVAGVSNISGTNTYNYNTNKMWGISSTKTTTGIDMSSTYAQNWLVVGY